MRKMRSMRQLKRKIAIARRMIAFTDTIIGLWARRALIDVHWPAYERKPVTMMVRMPDGRTLKVTPGTARMRLMELKRAGAH